MPPSRKNNRKNKNKIKKINTISLKQDALIAFLKKLAPALTMLCVFLIIFVIFKSVILKSPYFKIKNIKFQGNGYSQLISKKKIFDSCLNQNIFMVNIKQIARKLHMDYPELRKVLVKRVIPDTLEIDIIARVPVALVKSYKIFPIDQEGIILSPDIEIKSKMPMITGLSLWDKPRIGDAMRSSNITLGLSILKNIKKNKWDSKYALQRIDVSSSRNISLFLSNGLEVRIGDDANVQEKFKKFIQILGDPNIDVNNLAYVDLRFKDVVLGPR